MMNKQELNEAFSCVRASDDLIRETLTLDKEKKTSPWKIVRRVAACAAVVALLIGTMYFWPVEDNYVTGPGVLVVRAYETDEPGISEENGSVLEEGIVVPMEFTWSPADSMTSTGLGLPFRVSVPEEDYPGREITFEIWLSGGDFQHLEYMLDFLDCDTADSYDVLRARYLGKHFTISNNKRLWWNETGHIFDEQNREVHYVGLDTDRVFVDVILRADKYIIGYAVIEIVDVDGKEGFVYHTRMLKSVSFPQVNGKYQKVSEKYVQEQIQLVHDHA